MLHIAMMKGNHTSNKAGVLILTTLLSSFPYSQAANCNTQTISGSPSSSAIASFLTNALNQQGSGICAGGFPPTNPLTNVFNADEMDFNVTRSTSTGTLNNCNAAFTDIISQCVQGQNVWGGNWSVPDEFYSITNAIYPGNAIVIPGASSQTSSGTVQTTQIASSTAQSTPAGSPSSTPGGGFVITSGTNGPITIPPQTTTESGKFSTSYLAGITADTATTTTLSDQSGPTILPIWFCPECIAAAAGILIIPAAAPIAGGLIPPPPGFPALAIGPDGAPTPTGPTSGTQPSGDPRTQNPTGSAPETATTTDPSTSNAPTGTASESSITTPEVTGSCQYWETGNNKRDVEPRAIVKTIYRERTIERDVDERRGIDTSGEVIMSVQRPLISAIQAIGGPGGITSADGLTLVTTKFPKPDMENRFITGLQGKVSQTINENYNGQTIKMAKGDLFRIRWDYDPTKGVHVNAEFFGTTTTKIAFTPSTQPIVNPPGNANNVLFQQVINDQSNSLDYQTKPNTASHVYTPEERTGETSASTQAQTLQSMAQQLAQKWASSFC